MISPNPPPGDPEYTSEPKVLSPVSPKPLHYPTPENIPILEKQIDQAFNQTSAHMAQSASQQQQQGLPQPTGQMNKNTEEPNNNFMEQYAYPQTTLQHSQAVELGQNGGHQTYDMQTISQMNYAPSMKAPAEPNVAFAFAPASAPASESAPDAVSAPAPAQASNESIPASQHNPSPVDSSPSHANVPAQSPTAAQSTLNDAQTQDLTVKLPLHGVDDNTRGEQFQQNFKRLATGLSSQGNIPTANAPEADALTVPTTSSPISSASQPAPGTTADVTASSVGGPPPSLPPKPPAQEQPSMHPGYNHATDIRAYHPHSQLPVPQSSTKQEEAYGSNAQLPIYAPAPGQDAGPSASVLPPPPVASFQQQPSTTPYQQHPVQMPMQTFSESPAAQATRRQRELESQREIKQAAGEILGEDDMPWTPDTQRKYDVFLNEERKYVTEGNWEQFPQGSRLFVGKIFSTYITSIP